MHDLKKFNEQEITHSSTKLLAEYAKDHPDMDIFSVKKWSKIPHIKEYPLDEIVEHFKLPVPYFTSGPEYIIAYAIYSGYDEISYLGLNMTVGKEYIDQKPGMEFWTGMALGRGIKVNLQHNVTSLLKTRDSHLYGYLTKQWRIY